MRSWTSIPFYLWKNTCNRWIEHPVSPFAKILLPYLLALLGILVLVLFSQVERQLRDQLARQGLRTIVLTEVTMADEAPAMLIRSLSEESMWVGLFGRQQVNILRQPLASAVWQNRRGIPIIAYSTPLPGIPASDPAKPGIFLLQSPLLSSSSQSLSVAEVHFQAQPAPMPAWMGRQLDHNLALAVPLSIVTPLLHNGFATTTLIELEDPNAVAHAQTTLEAYYKSENRRFRILSSIEILENLRNLSSTQSLIRSAIFLAIAFILALMLGNVAMLEYRQDAYLLALLRSFGVPRILLLAHTLLENCLLVGSGVVLAVVSWHPLSGLVTEHFGPMASIRAIPRDAAAAADLATLFAAAAAGVFLSILPVTTGLRRPIGAVLQ